MWIYVLELNHGKYYVGRSRTRVYRLDDITVRNSWTRKHRPLTLMVAFPETDDFDQDQQTLRLMGRYGIDNVRGGSFIRNRLTETEHETIHRMIQSMHPMPSPVDTHVTCRPDNWTDSDDSSSEEEVDPSRFLLDLKKEQRRRGLVTDASSVPVGTATLSGCSMA
jgi:hypothetical protein